ncbi:Peptidyl-prolyl cis-trans isomerase-like 4 [Balamuthia mandrillaris]
MSVLIETSLGNIVVDLETKKCPNTSKNFLKLCKVKYYNGCVFHNVQKNYLVQTGDPTGTGRGGTSIYGLLYGEQARYFEDEFHPSLRHKSKGVLSMANAGQENTNGSQFFITMGEDLDALDDRNTVFGHVAEGMETVTRINDEDTDAEGRPYRIIRVLHTIILDDPFPDPPGLEIPDESPMREVPELFRHRLGENEEIESEGEGKDNDEKRRLEEELEVRSRAEVLEMIGDIPVADIRPPDNVLFVCKLNPITASDDLETIFSRFGEILECEVIRDKKTDESLCYAFIEFAKPEQCEAAWAKMENALIDDRRIHVDFSQSVSKMNKDRGEFGVGFFGDKYREYVASLSKPKQQAVLNAQKARIQAEGRRGQQRHDNKGRYFDRKRSPSSSSYRKRERNSDDDGEEERRRRTRSREDDHHHRHQHHHDHNRRASSREDHRRRRDDRSDRRR